MKTSEPDKLMVWLLSFKACWVNFVKAPLVNRPWIFSGRTDVESEAPVLWPPDMKSWLIGKDRDAGKDWRWEETGKTEDETVGWHHRLNGHESEQAPGDNEGQGSLACCSSWGRKESDTTERLSDWAELIVCPTYRRWVCVIDPELLWLWVFLSFEAGERPGRVVIYTLKRITCLNLDKQCF